ncbi:hypothetical protein ASG54_12725 [Aureimonas sp. Leaf460]|nr:hypothetical protein ASG62_08860 [Aureimonas sp. Leaf427]KQT77103.1 hypothetical protein ASG54_12725 [Aureimonas sp. Leaf460]
MPKPARRHSNDAARNELRARPGCPEATANDPIEGCSAGVETKPSARPTAPDRSCEPPNGAAQFKS